MINLFDKIMLLNQLSSEELKLTISIGILIIVILGLLIYLFFAKDKSKKGDDIKKRKHSRNKYIKSRFYV